MIGYYNKPEVMIYDMPEVTREEKYEETVSDEGLYGMPVLLLNEEGEFYRIRTHYSYEGYVKKEDLYLSEDPCLCTTEGSAQAVINGLCVDVRAKPHVEALLLISLVRGCLVEQVSGPGEVIPDADGQGANVPEGFCLVRLLDGRTGYVPSRYLSPKLFRTDSFDKAGTAADRELFSAELAWLIKEHFDGSEDAFRKAVTDTALSYLGSQYRWSGKTPLGIDCSGLTSISYMLNGVLTYRDARIVEGYPVRQIAREDLRPADLLYFPGHIAMYLGEDRYIHSTAAVGSNGVVINSLDPKDPLYRKDLDESLYAAGTIF